VDEHGLLRQLQVDLTMACRDRFGPADLVMLAELEQVDEPIDARWLWLARAGDAVGLLVLS
jgi:hypothetical protein